MRSARQRIAGVGIAITAAHAVLIALAWHGALVRQRETPPQPRRVTVRWVAPRPVAVPATSVTAVRRTAPRAIARTAAAAPPIAPSPAAAPATAPEPVSGAVFAMPTIAFGAPSPARWMHPRDEAASPPVDMAWIARQAQEAERARVAARLECETTHEHCE